MWTYGAYRLSVKSPTFRSSIIWWQSLRWIFLRPHKEAQISNCKWFEWKNRVEACKKPKIRKHPNIRLYKKVDLHWNLLRGFRVPTGNHKCQITVDYHRDIQNIENLKGYAKKWTFIENTAESPKCKVTADLVGKCGRNLVWSVKYSQRQPKILNYIWFCCKLWSISPNSQDS